MILNTINEHDWKVFRELRTVALERYCKRVLADAAELLAAERDTNHECYLALWTLLKERDRKLADTFNDPKRTTAKLAMMVIDATEPWTDDELAQWSPEIREMILQGRELRRS